MGTVGLELSDAGFLSAHCTTGDPALLPVPDRTGATEWPGFCFSDGTTLSFGRSAEDMWFIHPRRVVHNFWARLAHEPSTVILNGKPSSYSELAFFFLRDFSARLAMVARAPEKIVLALPGSYLKDPEAEEEKIGLLLGMAGELKLPLAGMIDLACAAICDPRSPGFNQALPIVVLDLNLDGADLTLLVKEEKISRRDFIHLPQCGLAPLLKQLTGTLGNRFLRHTAFDILEDGRIEQTFFRQTKEFLFSDAPEFRFLINTASRAYEMTAKRDQLVGDAQNFVTPVVSGLQAFLRASPHASEPCTIALTDRATRLPGLESRLRAAGYARLVRLPRGAAACGAARIGENRLSAIADLSDVPLETAIASSDTRSLVAARWEARLVKFRSSESRPGPTHAILGGVGHAIRRPSFTIGLAEEGADLPLPYAFSATEGLSIPLQTEDSRLWYSEPASARESGSPTPSAPRTLVESGDRLEIRCGGLGAEILFAHCPGATPGR